MIYFLNRGLILEQEVVKALKKYFSIIKVHEYYKNYTVSITNDHPFARLLLSDNPKKDALSIFPVIVVATEDDSKPSELSNLIDSDSITIKPDDLKVINGKTWLEKRYDMITPEILNELRAVKKSIHGQSLFIRRRDHISIEIWAENPQLKNELYELTRLFVCGFMKDYLSQLYKGYFSELGEDQSPLVIFDSSVRGQRSNNYNVEFGIELSTGQITFDADYIIEQTVIDTDIVDTKNLLWEVNNHVKEFITTERFAIGGSEHSGTSGSGESGSTETTGEKTGSTETEENEITGEKTVDG
jgi:hypothetical protein